MVCLDAGVGLPVGAVRLSQIFRDHGRRGKHTALHILFIVFILLRGRDRRLGSEDGQEHAFGGAGGFAAMPQDAQWADPLGGAFEA